MKTACTCTGPARPAHDAFCPVRKKHPRVDLGDLDFELYEILERYGVHVLPYGPMLQAMREASRLGQLRGDREATERNQTLEPEVHKRAAKLRRSQSR